MPEDLEDKIIDFGLILEGYCSDRPEDKQKNKIACILVFTFK